MNLIDALFKRTIDKRVNNQVAVITKDMKQQVEAQIVHKANEIVKSIGDGVKQDRKSLLYNPWYHMYQGLGYYERPTRLTFNVLKAMALKSPIVNAVINTRINQVSSFSKQVDIAERTQNKPLGFKVIHKHKPAKKMTKGELGFAQEMEDVITNCGYTERKGVKNRKRDRFRTFLRKITRDRLTYDQVVFEKVLNRKGEPAEFWSVDAGTIRLTSPVEMEKGVDYVQVIDAIVMSEFTEDELAFCVANPRTDIMVQGYGFSELEQMVSTITSHLYSDAYNSKFFSQGLGIQGILNLQTKDGQIPQDIMEAFRAQFQAMTSGVVNAWKTPVLNADKLEWINLKPSNRDMEYKAWNEYLIKITAAIYQIDPAEINFDLRGGAKTTTTFESGMEQKIKYSKDKGLKPLLEFVAEAVTEHIIEPYDKDFLFHFAGLDSKDEKEVIQLRTQEVKAYKTIDETREEAGLEPLGEDKGGGLILDPQYAQYLAGKAMAGPGEDMGESGPRETEIEEEEIEEEETE